MSLGTGALKVGREPERLRHSKEVSMATLRAGTTPACSRQLTPSHWRIQWKILTWSNTYQCIEREGRAGSQNPQRFAKQQIRKDQLKNASVRCNVSHKIKGPCGHPSDHVPLRRRPLTALACNLTLPKLHLATFIGCAITCVLPRLVLH